VAVHESFQSVVAYVVEASVDKGVPKLHSVTAGVHCNLAVNPLSVEAQVQGAALMGLATCLPGAAITLKDGVVQQQQFSATYVCPPHHRHAPASPCTSSQRRTADGMGEHRTAATGAGLRQRQSAA
jgi:CO/xanthine dehydrogenase Mo-binding subunit